MILEFITLTPSNLTSAIAKEYGKTLHYAQVTRFADGETQIIFDNPDFWRDKHAIILQTTYPSPHEQILHVAFLAHELKNAGCANVTTVIPYFGYSRQEKSHIPGKYGPAYVIAQLLQHAGINQLITIEAHTPVLKEFFTIPFNSVSLIDCITNHIRTHIDLSHGVTLIAVDKGAYARAQAVANKLGCTVIQFFKERYAQDKTKIISISDECNTPTAIIIDDIMDTGGTALQVCEELTKKGVHHIFGYFAHPVFSNNCLQKIETSGFEKVFVSNTIDLTGVTTQSKTELFDISRCIIEHLKI